MKTSQLTKLLKAAGCSIVRHGGNHDIWYSPIQGFKGQCRATAPKKSILGFRKLLKRICSGFKPGQCLGKSWSQSWLLFYGIVRSLYI